MDTLSQHGNITLNVILNGDSNLSNESTMAIFKQYRGLSKKKKKKKKKNKQKKKKKILSEI